MKKIKLSLLTLVGILTLSGCHTKDAGEELLPEIKEPEAPHFVEDQTTNLIENGITSYSIITPNKDSGYMSFATNELSNIFSKATGANFKISKDNEITSGTNFISLGDTAQFRQSHPDFDSSIFNNKDSKFMIDTVGKNIYLIGNTFGDDQSVLYASYTLLEDLLNYRFYTNDEIYYDTKETIKLPIYDKYVFEPSIDVRSIVNGDTVYDADYNKRAKVCSWYVNDTWCDSAKGHDEMSIVFAHYSKTNNIGIWTNNEGLQLCWSAFDVVGVGTGGKTSSEAAAERFIELFESYPNASYYMFGQEDVHSFCECDRCKVLMQEKAMNHAGLQIMYINRVCEHLKPWFEANPNRNIRIILYAYMDTKEAPVVFENGVYRPYSEDVIPDEHVCIEYAAIEANHVHPFTNSNISSNKQMTDIVDAWNSFIPQYHFIMYVYDTNFRNYFINFNNFGAIEEDYRYLASKGVFYIYSQGGVDTPAPGFQEMRFFVESNLMWDLNKYNHKDLTNEFMDHYYKDVRNEMYEYYEITREILTAACTSYKQGTASGGIYGDLGKAEIFTQEKVLFMNNLFKTMFGKIENIRLSGNEELADKLYLRVVREYLAIIYMNISYHKSIFTKAEIAEMKTIFNKYIAVFGMHADRENGSITLNFD